MYDTHARIQKHTYVIENPIEQEKKKTKTLTTKNDEKEQAKEEQSADGRYDRLNVQEERGDRETERKSASHWNDMCHNATWN